MDQTKNKNLQSVPSIDILMITHNRPEFTERSLKQLLSTCDDSMRVWIWHNGNHKETLDIVNSFQDHPRLHKLIISEENKKLREPTNWFWKNSSAKYFSKIDDDCLLPIGWAQKLVKVHESNPKLGVIGAWRFYDEDFVPESASKKIVKLSNDFEILSNPWVQGSGYIMKRECYDKTGPIANEESFTSYCIRAALSGWQNGWHYPFIHEEHMDDPRSDYYPYKTNEEFMKHRPLTAIKDGVNSLEEYKDHTKYMARIVQEESMHARDYSGWRMRKRNLMKRIRKTLVPGNRWG